MNNRKRTKGRTKQIHTKYVPIVAQEDCYSDTKHKNLTEIKSDGIHAKKLYIKIPIGFTKTLVWAKGEIIKLKKVTREFNNKIR
jgi:hypothetical protein